MAREHHRPSASPSSRTKAALKHTASNHHDTEEHDTGMEVEMHGSDGPPVGLSLSVPPSLSLDAVQSVLAGCGASVTREDLQSPTANVVIQVYTALLAIPTLRDAVTQYEKDKKDTERRNVDLEMQLHEAERLKDEAEKRAEESRAAREDSIRECSDMSSQLAEARGTLQSLQSNAESGSQESAEAKGKLERIQQEKRDLLEMLERERIESARRAGECDRDCMCSPYSTSIACQRRSIRSLLARATPEVRQIA